MSRQVLKVLLVLTFVILLSSCSSTPGNTNSVEATQAVLQTTVPLPTQFAGANLEWTASEACMVREFTSMQTDVPQGDLVAWSPVADILAYVEPTDPGWGQYVGKTSLYDPKTDQNSVLSLDQSVFGDLTWSPDGNSLAYVVLDQDRNVYTIRVAGVNDQSNIDIFSGGINPKTDEWSSPKGISGWYSLGDLKVTSSCGPDCSTAYSYNLQSHQLTQQDNIRKSEDASLKITNENTSPDERLTVTVDNDDNVWITSSLDKNVSLILQATPLEEIKWSADSKFFAIRTTSRVMIYESICTKK